MQLISTLTGTGWLRTKEAGSAVANYRLNIYRQTSGPEHGQFVTRGVLAAGPGRSWWGRSIARLCWCWTQESRLTSASSS